MAIAGPALSDNGAGVKYVVIYYSGPAMADKAALHFPAHRARWAEYRQQGTLLMIGPYTDRSGALGVFTTRTAAEEFVAGDPFVVEGLVERWEIREWMEALVPESG